jgi:predicted metal-dependent HD superfamily phosphohydrolase
LDRQRFRSLWARCRSDGSADGADRVFATLYRYYSQRSRHYHTPEHIQHCLQQFDLAADQMDDPEAVEMALWFHDAVYDVEAKDNEARSADLFADLVRDAVSEAFRRKVRDLIMITTHRQLPKTRDERFIVDVDLSSFGLPWADFVRDSSAVRAEFGDIADEEFYARQREFMQRLLARDTFCFTDFFRARHEATARDNIRRTIEAIDQRG